MIAALIIRFPDGVRNRGGVAVAKPNEPPGAPDGSSSRQNFTEILP